MKIKIPYMSYNKRLLFHLFDWGSLYFSLCVFASWYIHLSVFIFSIFFFLYYFYRRAKESFIYITSWGISGELIEVELYNRNMGPKLNNYNLKDIDVECFGSSQGQIASDRLILSVKGENKLVQYACGYWSVKLMKRISDCTLDEFQKSIGEGRLNK
ncbi:hypothetical protein GCM10007049_30910 [Echinicola pacifica]|uniref:Uncharacterized protein n=2 Tax=Echinicola pacifica TaxID=346377 RepID=A0A918Q8A7_9BACT|nr:hypothetical protein GCM10007049_30910 [Echinicola pacifica]